MKSTYIAADGYVTGGAGAAARRGIYGICVYAGATLGNFTLTDGDGGATLVQIDTPASTDVVIPVIWAPEHIDATESIYADVTNCKGTVFWG